MESISGNIQNSSTEITDSAALDIIESGRVFFEHLFHDENEVNFILDLMVVLVERNLDKILDHLNPSDFESAIGSFLLGSNEQIHTAYAHITEILKRDTNIDVDFYVGCTLGMLVETYSRDFVKIFQMIREANEKILGQDNVDEFIDIFTGEHITGQGIFERKTLAKLEETFKKSRAD